VKVVLQTAAHQAAVPLLQRMLNGCFQHSVNDTHHQLESRHSNVGSPLLPFPNDVVAEVATQHRLPLLLLHLERLLGKLRLFARL